MGNWAAKIFKALYNRKTAPNYVKVQLLHPEICANFCKSIYYDNDKIMGTLDANITKTLSKGQYVYNRKTIISFILVTIFLRILTN